MNAAGATGNACDNAETTHHACAHLGHPRPSFVHALAGRRRPSAPAPGCCLLHWDRGWYRGKRRVIHASAAPIPGPDPWRDQGNDAHNATRMECTMAPPQDGDP
jgi:hypothetical protein